jgi:hypothetical protein
MIWYPDKRAVNMKVKDPVVNNRWRRFLRPLIVVDVPFGIRGGLEELGQPFPPETMVLATADGHPSATG